MSGQAETSTPKTSKDPQRGSAELDYLMHHIHALKDRTSECLEDAGAAACTSRQRTKPETKIIETEPKEAKKFIKTEKIHPAIALGEIVSGFYQDEDAKRYIMEKARALAMVTAPAATPSDASVSTGNTKNENVEPEKPNNRSIMEKPTALAVLTAPTTTTSDASVSTANKKNKKVQPEKPTNRNTAQHQKKEYKMRDRSQKITEEPAQSFKSELSKLQAQTATNEVMKSKKRGRPKKNAQQPAESLEPELRDSEEDHGGCQAKTKKARSGWPKNKPRNPTKRLIWEQEQLKKAMEKPEEQLSAEIDQRQPDLQKQTQETPQQGPEIATDIQEEEVQQAIEIHDQQPETQQEMHLEEGLAIMKSPKEPKREEDGSKTAICAGLANIMLQMTKISGELAKLIGMISGGSQEG